MKTTGGKGLHVHLPLNRHQDFGEARGFARDAANVLAARHPDVVTTEQRKDGRGGRVYADVMRDSYAQTVVAPYSVRARPGAHVATPLHWAEAEDPGLTPARFTLRTLGERLAGTAGPLGRHVPPPLRRRDRPAPPRGPGRGLTRRGR